MTTILINILLILQIIAIIFIIVDTYKRHKADKAFWKKQDEISNEFLKQLTKLQSERLEKGEVDSEQEDTNKE